MKCKNYILLLFITIWLFSCNKENIEPIPTPNPEPSGPTIPTHIPNTQAPQTKGATYWWNKAVFYEIFVRSFYDSNGDGIGDLKGIEQKLDYIQNDLGATAIWLMPINPSPSYHGYDVTDYKDINPNYGTKQDFNDLVKAIHSRGMKIIIDLVINHTAINNPWFKSAITEKNSPYKDFYIFSDEKKNYNGPWGQTVWHSLPGDDYWLETLGAITPEKKQYMKDLNQWFYGVFSNYMPDLNYKNQKVKDQIKSISDFWLKDVDVDGFRLDAVKFITEEGSRTENTPSTFAYWKEFSNNVKAAKPEAMTVAEAWASSNTVIKYVNSGFDLAFEFDLSGAILNSVKNNNPTDLKNKLKSIRDAYPYHQYATFLSNHDQDRSYETMGKNLANAKLAASVLLTLPGTPFIYYAEEVGVWGRKSGGDEWVRKPMNWTASGGFTTGTPWSGLTGDQATQNVATQKANHNSLLSWYKKLNALRKQYPQLSEGTFQTLGSNGGTVYAYLRESEKQAIVVIHNFGKANYDNTTVFAKQSNLAEGTYTVTDLLEDKKLEDIALNSDGGFLFKPLPSIAAKHTKLLLIKKK